MFGRNPLKGLKVLVVKPGDVLVVRVNARGLSGEQAAHLKAMFAREGIRAAIISDELDVVAVQESPPGFVPLDVAP